MEPQQRWTTSRQVALHLQAYSGAGPNGPSAVVLHGMGTGVDVLRDAVPGVDPYAALAAHGVNVMALDWPGHGRSGGHRGHLTYRTAMGAAAAAVRAARREWGGPVALVGTALGGPLAFYAALEGDGVAAVVCHDLLDLRDVRPALSRRRQQALLPLAARVGAVLPRRLQARVPLPTGAVVAAADLAGDPALSRRLRRHPQAVRAYDLGGLVSILLTPEDKPDVAAQTVPLLALVGGADRVLPPQSARSVVARVAGRGELVVIPGGGHQLLLERPSDVLPRIATFLLDACSAA